MSPASYLRGKTVLITRGKKESKAFSRKISEQGGLPIAIPLIGFKKAELDNTSKYRLAKAAGYDWVIFTSKKGVQFFMERVSNPALPHIAVIGEKTEAELRRNGYSPAFVPSHYVAECFAEEFTAQLKPGSRVLVIKGNLARTVIAEKVRQAGHICEEVILYENVLPEGSKEALRQALLDGSVDIVTFTSSSTVEHFMEAVEEYGLHAQLKPLLFACIGPVADATAKSCGLDVQIVGSLYKVDGLLEAMNHYTPDVKRKDD